MKYEYMNGKGMKKKASFGLDGDPNYGELRRMLDDSIEAFLCLTVCQ
jgi:hypothetical protein